MRREFPSLFYVVKPSTPDSAEYYYATWTGISGDLLYHSGYGADTSLVTNEWLDQHIRSIGPLGKLYPRIMYIMEGDTPSFLNLLDNGLNAYRRPDWGGWGGRYVYRKPYGESHRIWSQGGSELASVTSQDTVIGVDGREYTSDQATIWRWRAAYQNDFAARMDWTIKDFAHANHNPELVVNGQAGTAPLEMDAEPSQTIVLNANGSKDPDSQALHYKWFVYPEAGLEGTHEADVSVGNAEEPRAIVSVKSPCVPSRIPSDVPCQGEGVAHIILAVTDNGSPPLTSYRRVILHVHPPADLAK
jgi:hypothetical protein